MVRAIAGIVAAVAANSCMAVTWPWKGRRSLRLWAVSEFQQHGLTDQINRAMSARVLRASRSMAKASVGLPGGFALDNLLGDFGFSANRTSKPNGCAGAAGVCAGWGPSS